MKSLRIVQLAIFAMLVWGGAETAFADPIYSFTTIAVPGAIVTSAYGINDSGQIVGFVVDSILPLHGFLDVGGSFTTIDEPGATGVGTTPRGINDSGQIVGDGFVDTGGTFTTFDVPGAEAYGINNSGQIVGFVDSQGGQGFVDTDGNFTTIDVPGAIGTFAYGINDSGQIVGVFVTEGQGGFSHFQGFVDTGGSITTIDVPGASQTNAYGINDSGQIVGDFIDGNGEHGFLDTGGNFTTIDVPGEPDTVARGINDSGQIVGYTSSSYSFLATPVPEPSGLLSLATCLVALSAMACRRKCVRAGITHPHRRRNCHLRQGRNSQVCGSE